MFLPGDRVQSIQYPGLHEGVVSEVNLLQEWSQWWIEWTDGCEDIYGSINVNQSIEYTYQYVSTG